MSIVPDYTLTAKLLKCFIIFMFILLFTFVYSKLNALVKNTIDITGSHHCHYPSRG